LPIGVPGLYEVYAQAITELPHGEYLQIQAKKHIMKLKSHNVPHDLLLFEYLEKSHYKTGSLFTHLLKGTAMICGLPERDLNLIQALGLQLGLSFQIADDLIDVTKSTAEIKKDGLNDLKEQNTTCPYLLFALQKHREGKIVEHDRLFVIIQKKEKSLQDLAEVVAMLRDSDAEQKTRDLVHHLFTDALKTFAQLPVDDRDRHAARLTACSLPFLDA
jgi:all-trans-nonaprenyl-diphosphate synthase